MSQIEIQGLKMDLERIGQMTQEDIDKIKEQNTKLQNQINMKKQDIQQGNIEGKSKREKGKNYQKLIDEIDRLTQQIDTNKQIIETYVKVRVERGDFKSWGIKNMDDFIKASKKSYDISIEEDKKQIKEIEKTKDTLKETNHLQEINLFIERKNQLLSQIKENVKKIEEIKRKISENEKKIKSLEDSLGKIDEDKRDGVRNEIDQLKVDNINLQMDKKTFTDENRLYILQVQGFDHELEQNGITKTDEKSLEKVYNNNKSTIQQNTKDIKEFLTKAKIDYSNLSVDMLENEINKRKENINDLIDKKIEMNKSKNKMNEKQADNNQNPNTQTTNANKNTQQQTNNGPTINQNQNVAPSYSYQNSNLPVATNNESIFTKAQKGLNNLIDRFNPKLRQQRIEFVKKLHPDWDDKTIVSVANNKYKAVELNDLIKKGVTPEIYAKSEENKEKITKPNKNENIISDAAMSFDKMIKLESVVNDPKENYSDEAKEGIKRFKQRIIKSTQKNSKDDDRGDL